jgi:hypothetical protein
MALGSERLSDEVRWCLRLVKLHLKETKSRYMKLKESMSWHLGLNEPLMVSSMIILILGLVIAIFK